MPASRTEKARITLERLRDEIETPETELRYTNPYELIVAVMLSAQCTDERVNKVTPSFFEAFPTVQDLARAETEDVYPLIKSVTYPNSKSKHLIGMARRVVNEYGGKIPETTTALMTLQGVGRKTAQVVASVAFEVDALPVDTHFFRVANRIGLTKNGADTPFKVERQIKRIIPKSDWGVAHHLLILHGRYTCTARHPKCKDCPLTSICTYYQRMQRLPDAIDHLDSTEGRYYCKTHGVYFDDPASKVDRYGVEQISCPTCGSMNVFNTRTGETTKQVLDFRVNG